MKPKYLNDKDPWMLGEDIPNCDLFFSNIWLRSFVSEFGDNTGRAYRKIACRYEGYHLWFYFGEKDSHEVGSWIANRIVTEPEYGETINTNIIIQADKISEFAKTIPNENLDNLSDKDLWKIYKDHLEVHKEYYTWCWIPVGADMFGNQLTDRIKGYLNNLGISVDDVNEALVTLTQPTEKSLIFIEQENLLKIAEKIEEDEEVKKNFLKNNDLPLEISEMLEKHRQKYKHTKHIWVSGEFTKEDYIKQIKEVFDTKIPVSKILSDQNQELVSAKDKKDKLIKYLKLDENWQRVLKSYGDFMTTKIYRRYAQLSALYRMSPILKEIAKRKYITEKQVRFMQAHEVEDLLLHNKIDEAEMLERTKECVLYAEDGFDAVYTGKEAKPFLESFKKEVDTNVSELKGDTGCTGYAKGKVKIIIRAEEMDKMNEGDILVSIATDPDIVPAMKKAAAIVTEQGGVTSHAAIVSRELKIPCVIGTKIATQVLKDGDIVEVDASKGIVKRL